MATTLHHPTDRFSGNCDRCDYPVVIELPGSTLNFVRHPCPECRRPIRLERLFGVYSDRNCNAECQYAMGNLCSCACGGKNHRVGYLTPTHLGEVPASAVSRYRRNKALARRRGEARRAANARSGANTQQSFGLAI